MSYDMEEAASARFVTLDIETVPQARFVDPDQYAGLGTGGAPLVIEHEYATDAFHQGEKNGFEILSDAVVRGDALLEATHLTPSLHATTCHIVQVSFGWRAPMGNQPAELHRKVLQSNLYRRVTGYEGLALAAEAERDLLHDALEILRGTCLKKSTIVSFNGKQFDIPLLRARLAILGVSTYGAMIPWRRLLYPYDDNQHADLRLILSGDDRRARGTLQWWAEALGIHAEEHGAEVFEWVRSGEWGKLDIYGMTEAQTLVEMYERVRPIL